jgi:hypothetical protein
MVLARSRVYFGRMDDGLIIRLTLETYRLETEPDVRAWQGCCLALVPSPVLITPSIRKTFFRVIDFESAFRPFQ